MKPTFIALSILAVVSSVSASTPCGKYSALFDKSAKVNFGDLEGGVWDFRLLLEAQAYVESRCDPRAVSPTGAQGIGQILPSTWRDIVNRSHFSIGNPFNPSENTLAQGWYLRNQYKQVYHHITTDPQDVVLLALASYNDGYGNVSHANESTWSDAQRHLPRSVIKYVGDIMEYYNTHKGRIPPKVDTHTVERGENYEKFMALLIPWINVLISLVIMYFVVILLDLLLGRNSEDMIERGNLAVIGFYAVVLTIVLWIIIHHHQ